MEEAARIFLNILKGKGTQEQNNVVLANAAVGLNLIKPDKNLTECVELARESLMSGRAFDRLKSVTCLS